MARELGLKRTLHHRLQGGQATQRDLAMDREEALATTARVHARLQSDHGERATCTYVLQKRHAK